jgi:hypothetical protein
MKTPEKSRVLELIQKEAFKEALELAKKQFKKKNTPEAREELIQAYVSRIDHLARRDEAESAENLMSHLLERFPEAQLRMLALNSPLVGDPKARREILLKQRMALDPASSEFATVNRLLAVEIDDPAHIADSPLLPHDHPLKIEARTVIRALEAVTSVRKCGEALDSLRCIGRHSPFAAWRRLICAIAAFFREDSADMERHLSGIPEKHPTLVAAEALRAMNGNHAFQGNPAATEAFARLQQGVFGTRQKLLNDVTALFSMDDREPIAMVRRAEKLLPKIEKEFPELLDNVCRTLVRRVALTGFAKAFDGVLKLTMKHGLGLTDFLLISGRELFKTDRSDLGIHHLGSVPFSPGGIRLPAEERAFLLREVAGRAYDEGMDRIPLIDARGKRVILSPVDLLRESLDIHPSHEAYADYFAFALHAKTEEKSKLLRHLEDWKKLSPDTVEPILVNVVFLIQKGEFAQVEERLLEAMRIDPFNTRLRLFLIKHCKSLLKKRLQDTRPFDTQELLRYRRLLPGNHQMVLFCDLLLWAKWEGMDWPKPNPVAKYLPPLHEAVLQLVRRAVQRNVPETTGMEMVKIAQNGFVPFLNDLASIVQVFKNKPVYLPLATVDAKLFPEWLQKCEVSPEVERAVCLLAALSGNQVWLFWFSRAGLARGGRNAGVAALARSLAFIDSHPPRSASLMLIAKRLANDVGDQELLKFIQDIPTSRLLHRADYGEVYGFYGIVEPMTMLDPKKVSQTVIDRILKHESMTTPRDVRLQENVSFLREFFQEEEGADCDQEGRFYFDDDDLGDDGDFFDDDDEEEYGDEEDGDQPTVNRRNGSVPKRQNRNTKNHRKQLHFDFED